MERFKIGHQDPGFLLLGLSYLLNKNTGHLVRFDFRDREKTTIFFNISLSHIASYILSLPDTLCQLSSASHVRITLGQALGMR